MPTVEITIRFATLKENFDTFGKMENYVKVKAYSGDRVEEAKTRITDGDNKGEAITWNQVLQLNVAASSEAQFQFTVMDEDTKTDDVCGVGRLNLGSCGVLQQGVVNKYNIMLHHQKNEQLLAGSLHITTKML